MTVIDRAAVSIAVFIGVILVYLYRERVFQITNKHTPRSYVQVVKAAIGIFYLCNLSFLLCFVCVYKLQYARMAGRKLLLHAIYNGRHRH